MPLQLTIDGTSAVADLMQIGELELSQGIKRVKWQNEEVRLTVNEFRIVDALARGHGGDVAHREIYDLVRGKDFISGQGPEGYRQNVRSIIKRIRHKFREVDRDFAQIENYRDFGYRWRSTSGGTVSN